MGSTPEEIEEALKVAGDDKGSKECIPSETPRHKVTLTQPFYLGVREVTQAQYQNVKGQNPAHFSATGGGKDAAQGQDNSSYPVENVTWYDATVFCGKLCELAAEKAAGRVYRLPTEAEWEFACRAGTTTKYWIGDTDEQLKLAGWISQNAGRRTHAVGELLANPFGLYDVHGNVWEWCSDWQAAYPGNAVDPRGPASGTQRVLRGGSWFDNPVIARAAFRYRYSPEYRDSVNRGFRVVLSIDATKPADNTGETNAAPPSVPGEWSEPVNLGPVVNSSADDGAPFISADGLMLLFETNRNANNKKNREIWISTRGKTGDPWSAPHSVGDKINSADDACEPELSGDGLTLYFTASRSGQSSISMTQRQSRDGPFDNPKPVPGAVNAAGFNSACSSLSADGLTMFFQRVPVTGGGWYVWQSTRARVGDPFGTPVDPGSGVSKAPSPGNLSLSHDGLKLFFTVHAGNDGQDRDLWMSARRSTRDSFGPAVNLGSIVNTPYKEMQPCVSHDGGTLYFSSNRPGGQGGFDLWMSTRKPRDSVAAGPAPYVWPKDAPPPAIAPFNETKAKEHQEAWAKHLGVKVEFENSIGMKFRLIPPGEFMMGSTPEETEARLKLAGDDKPWQEHIKSEVPRHKVTLTQPFYLGVYEVTQAQYQKVMGKNPAHFATTGEGKAAVLGQETALNPVERVSWDDTTVFFGKLSELAAEKTAGRAYRLPTEAEWEFACRAGTTTKYSFGDSDDQLKGAGWFNANSGGRTHAVGELIANPFGLYDTHGNVWEWCNDWHGGYAGSEVNPVGPASGTQRVLRGGMWDNNPEAARAARRLRLTPDNRDVHPHGFRVALSIDAAKAKNPDEKSASVSGEPKFTAELLHTLPGNDPEFVLDGKLLRIGREVYDPESGELVRDLLPTSETRDLAAGPALSRDGSRLAWITTDGELTVWDATANKAIWTEQVGSEWTIVRMHPAGTLIATAFNKRVSVWDIATHKPTTEFDMINNMHVHAFRFSPSGKWLGAGTCGRWYLWDSATNSRKEYDLPFWATGFAFAPDETQMVVSWELNLPNLPEEYIVYQLPEGTERRRSRLGAYRAFDYLTNDQDLLVAKGRDLYTWKPDGDSLVGPVATADGSDRLSNIAVSPAERHFATEARQSGNVQVWRKRPLSAADRKAAEALLQYANLAVVVGGKRQTIERGGTLPRAPFALTEIHISYGELPPRFVEDVLCPAVAALQSLQNISDSSNRIAASGGKYEMVLNFLAASPSVRTLKTIRLFMWPNPETLNVLAKFDGVSSVLLYCGSDADIAKLQSLRTTVTDVALHGFNESGKITREGQVTLAKLPFESLTIGSLGRVDRQWFEHLAGSPRLKRLNFPYSVLSDEKLVDLVPLTGSKSIECLGLAPATTEETANKVAELLPRLRIEWGSKVILPKIEKLSPPVGETVNLLPLIDPAIHSRNGRWEKKEGELLSPMGVHASLELPINPAADYRIEGTAERVRGDDCLNFGIVAGEGEVGMLFEGFGNKTSGLEKVSGKSVPEQATKYLERVFKTGHPTRIVIEVSPRRVHVTGDEKVIADWEGDSKQLNPNGEVKAQSQTSQRALYFSTWNSRYRITKLTYTALADDDAKATAAPPVAPPGDAK